MFSKFSGSYKRAIGFGLYKVISTHLNIVIGKHAFLPVYVPFHPSFGHGFDVGDQVAFLQRQFVRLAGFVVKLDHSLCTATKTRVIQYHVTDGTMNVDGIIGETEGKIRDNRGCCITITIIIINITNDTKFRAGERRKLEMKNVRTEKSRNGVLTHWRLVRVRRNGRCEVFHLAEWQRQQQRRRRRRQHVMSSESARRMCCVVRPRSTCVRACCYDDVDCRGTDVDVIMPADVTIIITIITIIIKQYWSWRDRNRIWKLLNFFFFRYFPSDWWINIGKYFNWIHYASAILKINKSNTNDRANDRRYITGRIIWLILPTSILNHGRRFLYYLGILTILLFS